MDDYLPSLENKETRLEYAGKIDNLFERTNLDWLVSPAAYSSFIFIKPRTETDAQTLNTEWCPFLNVAKIGIYSKDGIACLGIIAYPMMKNSESEKILRSRGYSREKIKGHNLFLMAKQLKNLESLAEEIKDIKKILVQDDRIHAS